MALKRTISKIAATCAVTSLLAACGSSGFSGSDWLGGSDKPQVKEAATTAAAGDGVPQIDPEIFRPAPSCPTIRALPGASLLQKFKRGGEDDPQQLLFLANISDSSRTCHRVNGGTQVKLGLAGRVTPGPEWQGGAASLPVRVAIVKSGSDEKPVYAQLFKVPVEMQAGQPAQTWVKVEENIVIPNDGGYELIFGFDEK
ncbi:hypothetical protein [Polycladidibacter hongkongensis]|uniref:hypothetical protein n=1 Tax=Polycladidibacter hongkongensis TaxID=1647556 RepID=UPI00082CD1BF|nr:hypothetical protein [Pseudovibrio hongkongensis]